MNKPVINGFRPNHCLNSVLIEGRIFGPVESIGQDAESFKLLSMRTKDDTGIWMDTFTVESFGQLAALVIELYGRKNREPYVRVVGKLSTSGEEVVIIAEHIEALTPRRE